MNYLKRIKLINTEDGRSFRVDIGTGEILTEYITRFFKPEINRLISITSKIPESARHVEEVEEYMKVAVDRRKLMVTSNIEELFNISSGYSKIKRTPALFKVPYMTTIKLLAKMVRYRNIVIDSRENIAKGLGVDISNLNRTLKSLSEVGYIKIFTKSDDMHTGQIKILISPAYVFKAEKGGFNDRRDNALRHWYITSRSDHTLSALLEKPKQAA